MDNMTYSIGGATSLGPTNDGRIKPEIVAGGVNITSTIPVNSYATYRWHQYGESDSRRHSRTHC